MKHIFGMVGAAFVVVAAVMVIGLIVSYPFMLLWNSCLVPAINGVNQIEWFQAWGIILLCGFMFKDTNTKSEK